MKKTPSPEQEISSSAQTNQESAETAGGADSEEAMSGLQADLDRFRELAIRAFDLLFGGSSTDAQHFVIIAFVCSHEAINPL